MAGRTWLTQEQINEMKEYDAANFTYKDIAQAMNVSVWTVSRHLGGKRHRTKITDEVIERMEELRTKGLSNAQIGIELSIDPTTVKKYIGEQKKRSEYGSLIAHVTGESFVEKEEKKIQRKLKLTNTSISCDGRDFSYKASTDGRVRITSSTGIQIDITKDQLLCLIAELCEIGDWLSKNALDNDMCYLEA